MIYLREDAYQQLVVSFDLQSSNADRLPAFVVMLHRFVHSIRERKPVFAARNVEVNQPLRLAVDDHAGDLTIITQSSSDSESVPIPRVHLLRSPPSPGFFHIRQKNTLLLEAAARFADGREADFMDARSVSAIPDHAEQVIRQNSEPDRLAPLWIVLTVSVLLASWMAPGRTGG